jgi:hypothetical protein
MYSSLATSWDQEGDSPFIISAQLTSCSGQSAFMTSPSGCHAGVKFFTIAYCEDITPAPETDLSGLFHYGVELEGILRVSYDT